MMNSKRQVPHDPEDRFKGFEPVGCALPRWEYEIYLDMVGTGGKVVAALAKLNKKLLVLSKGGLL